MIEHDMQYFVAFCAMEKGFMYFDSSTQVILSDSFSLDVRLLLILMF